MKGRYDRQLKALGKGGQTKLGKARVIVLGAGGLGTACLNYLAMAGVGHIRIVDKDRVELSNLNRQLYRDRDVGRLKAVTAKLRLTEMNPGLDVEAITAEVGETNIDTLIEKSDIVVDCLDSIEARLLVSDSADRMRKPLVHGAVEGMNGFQLTCLPGGPYLSHLKGKGAQKGKPPVIGAAAGVIASLQALEVVKLVTGKGTPNTELLVFDGENNSFQHIKIRKRR